MMKVIPLHAEEDISELTEETADEMPTLINITKMNKSLYLESAAAMGKRWKGLIFTVLAAACAVYGLFVSNWVLLVLSLIVAIIALFSHLLLAYRDFGRLKRRYGAEEWIKTIRFYDDYLETSSEGSVPSVYPYRSIRREYETEHMYVLDFGSAGPATTLAKDGFTLGTFEEMKKWLTERQLASYDQDLAEEDDD